MGQRPNTLLRHPKNWDVNVNNEERLRYTLSETTCGTQLAKVAISVYYVYSSKKELRLCPPDVSSMSSVVGVHRVASAGASVLGHRAINPDVQEKRPYR